MTRFVMAMMTFFVVLGTGAAYALPCAMPQETPVIMADGQPCMSHTQMRACEHMALAECVDLDEGVLTQPASSKLVKAGGEAPPVLAVLPMHEVLLAHRTARAPPVAGRVEPSLPLPVYFMTQRLRI